MHSITVRREAHLVLSVSEKADHFRNLASCETSRTFREALANGCQAWMSYPWIEFFSGASVWSRTFGRRESALKEKFHMDVDYLSRSSCWQCAPTAWNEPLSSNTPWPVSILSTRAAANHYRLLCFFVRSVLVCFNHHASADSRVELQRGTVLPYTSILYPGLTNPIPERRHKLTNLQI